MRSSALCRRSVLDGAGQDATRLVSPQLTLSAEGQSRLARRRRGAISRLSDPATLNSRSFPTPNPPHGRHWCRGISLCPFAARSPPSPRLRGQPHPNHALLSNKTPPTGVASLRAASAARAPNRGREAGVLKDEGRGFSPHALQRALPTQRSRRRRSGRDTAGVPAAHSVRRRPIAARSTPARRHLPTKRPSHTQLALFSDAQPTPWTPLVSRHLALSIRGSLAAPPPPPPPNPPSALKQNTPHGRGFAARRERCSSPEPRPQSGRAEGRGARFLPACAPARSADAAFSTAPVRTRHGWCPRSSLCPQKANRGSLDAGAAPSPD